MCNGSDVGYLAPREVGTKLLFVWPRQVPLFEILRQLVEVNVDDVVSVQRVRNGAGSSKIVERTSVVLRAQFGGRDGSTSGGTDFGKPTCAVGR
jgi:hypothetical protein